MCKIDKKRILEKEELQQQVPRTTSKNVTDYHVRCSVVSRYAVTTVQSSVWNQLSVTKEAAFEVDLPILSPMFPTYTLFLNKMDHHVRHERSGGEAVDKHRETEKFRVAVSVPAGAQMLFCLTYEELLPRRLGRYELSLGLRPGQLVQNLTLDVSITEQTEAPASTRVEQNPCCARVHYSPSLQQQSSVSPKGVHADFMIQYDVALRDLMGEVQVHDGYFVHYFAPKGLPVVPKDVIFVIDVSGSMIGTKIKQTKQAMSTILADLREGDHFNIITFSDQVHTWKRGRTVRATRQNVRDFPLSSPSGTNINAALLSAAQLINPPSSSRHLASHRVPLVIFLTDGEATIGETAGDTILTNARKALGSASLFGLAFGDDADFLLLKRLALDNRGVARMVYEDADAALQLKGFYDDEVASPLLSDVQLSYLDDQAFDVTRSLFPNYFQGSELVVAGKVKPGVKDLKISMSATDSRQRVKMENRVLTSQTEGNGSVDSLDCLANLEGIPNVVHRLWAYFTIKELLQAKLNTTDPATQRLLVDKATNLSLRYNFVTPVTSLVVVQPELDEVDSATTAAAATITTTATTTATTKASAVGVGKKPGSPPKGKPDPPRAPPTKTKAAVPPPRRTTTTSSPSSVKSPPAPFGGKKPGTTQHSKTAPPPAGGKIPTSLINSLKTASAPAPGKLSTALKTTSPSPPLTAPFTSPSLNTARTDTVTQYGRPLTPQLGPVGSTAAPQVDNSVTSAPELPQPETVVAPPALPSSPALPTPAPVPATEHNDTHLELAPGVASFVTATFAPMPGVTDEPNLWEAAGILGRFHTPDLVFRVFIDSIMEKQLQ
uniref:Inter-alpha-trypsin inhibitor heavy chain family member 6 n=1 Tax=Takifugu rubripes TaxID=31033 RepID=H2TGX6_TAKRU